VGYFSNFEAFSEYLNFKYYCDFKKYFKLWLGSNEWSLGPAIDSDSCVTGASRWNNTIAGP
jgi:hypothetical protein